MKTTNILPITILRSGNRFLIATLSCLLLLFFSTVTTIQAQGDLLVMPKRVVFEGSKRSQELNLANTGKDTARYVISLVHYKMNVDGSFREITTTDSSWNFADKFIRFFPRSVRLGPGESQSVRVQLTQSSKLTEGEYRSHIYFRAVPDEAPLGDTNAAHEDPSSISVQLTPVFGISIPVIIRVGESTAQISLSNCSFEMFDKKTPLMNMTLNRTGNMSVYGDILIEYVSPENKVIKVGSAQGLALYTPNLSRNIRIGLNNTAGVDYSKGKLHVIYRAQENGNPNNIAQTEVYLH